MEKIENNVLARSIVKDSARNIGFSVDFVKNEMLWNLRDIHLQISIDNDFNIVATPISEVNDMNFKNKSSSKLFTINELLYLEQTKKLINNNELLYAFLYNYFINFSLESYIKVCCGLFNINFNEKIIADAELIIKNKNDEYLKGIVKADRELIKVGLESYFNQKFENKKNYFSSDNSSTCVLLIEAQNCKKSNYKYWYTYHSYQDELLKDYENKYLCLFFKDKIRTILVPIGIIETFKDHMNVTKTDDQIGWHIYIEEESDQLYLYIPKLDNIKLNGVDILNL